MFNLWAKECASGTSGTEKRQFCAQRGLCMSSFILYSNTVKWACCKKMFTFLLYTSKEIYGTIASSTADPYSLHSYPAFSKKVWNGFWLLRIRLSQFTTKIMKGFCVSFKMLRYC
jgi:hypothetical protein